MHAETDPARAPNQRRRRVAAVAVFAPLAASVYWPAAAQSFDHGHAAWTALLKKHVVVLRGGQATQVRYAGFTESAGDRVALQGYLGALSAVPAATFTQWSRAQRMAFLINAYNAFTVELILTRYPSLQSIKDLGTLFRSPWKPQWIALLGGKVSLDDIEHEILRKRGAYDDPRVHFAVNCASVGCPALRDEAYVAERLEAQLDEQTQRFMADRTRNRYNAQSGRLEVSRIFDWFGEDFRLGHRGIASLPAFFARHADALADAPAERAQIRSMQVEITFLDYDWKLNDAR